MAYLESASLTRLDIKLKHPKCFSGYSKVIFLLPMRFPKITIILQIKTKPEVVHFLLKQCLRPNKKVYKCGNVSNEANFEEP